ncbi:hypothetical protein KM043_004748 [Ampulex compressa]|nr:hypothetical protein KM043_004748 [Ampulex compressa]
MQKQLSQVNILDDDCIQGALESALLTIKPKSIIRPTLVLSSRTDAGVHALCNAAHVDLKNKYYDIYKPEVILRYVNTYMAKCSHNIRLLECIPVKNDFHARYNAKSRTYMYRFMVPKKDSENRIPIMELPYCHLIRDFTFDIEKVKHATRLFVGYKDFTTFVSKYSQLTGVPAQSN